jgi:hypothetical protein
MRILRDGCRGQVCDRIEVGGFDLFHFDPGRERLLLSNCYQSLRHGAFVTG